MKLIKSLTRRSLAIILAVSAVFCLAGCARVDPTFLNEKVTAMIDLCIEHDTPSRYSMLYPGVTDMEAYQNTAELTDQYFPVTTGYTWRLQQWKVTKSVNRSNVLYEGQYQVEFEGKVFYIYAVWRSDSNGEGFTRFQIIDEKDWTAEQNNSTRT